MKRRNAEMLGDLVRQVMREEGLESPYNEYRLIHEAWPEVMGQGIVRYTGNLTIRNRVLYVQLRSSVLRQELMAGRQSLVYRLNQFLGAQVIEHIVFN